MGYFRIADDTGVMNIRRSCSFCLWIVQSGPSIRGDPKPRMALRAGFEVCSTVHLAKSLLRVANVSGCRAHQPPAISRRAVGLART